MSLRISLGDWLARRRETMECRAAVELMTCYLDGAMNDRVRRRFEAHLGACPACTAYLEQLRVTVAVLGRLEPDRIDPEVRTELISIYRALSSR